ncbi:serine/threonine-protein kinase Chk1-like [Oratosquilla oratoria]|uniref:serine/threonine-protein kinase Chk1-like n=1 Tax=Oratosquilla oratoria TaxID=337810 RepID=UPI003F76C624
MEYCPGGDVRTAIDKNLRTEDPLGYFHQLMVGVEHLHERGVAHRDLKPTNLLRTEDRVIKIADFGLAEVFVVGGEEFRLEGIVGTPAYMAPEIIRAPTYLGPPVDLWSCGVILVNLLTCRMPWRRTVEKDDDLFRMWVEKYPKTEDLPPWRDLDESSRALVDHLREPDAFGRLSGRRKFRGQERKED